MKSFMAKVWEFIKQKCWYIILLSASSAYVWYYRYEIYQLKEINARNLIFLLWLLLLLVPLFSEMEFLGVKVKKEVEKATEEVKESLQNLQTQMNQIQLTNSVATNFNFSNTPLPSEQKIEELLQMVKELQSTYPGTNVGSDNSAIVDGDKNVFLFKVRLDIETSLRELCEKIGCYDRIPMMKMTHLLNRAEVINGMTCDLIGQVIKIANRGVHGEIVSAEYVTFVEETYPEIMRQLKAASSRLVHITCPKCKYSGYSTHENVCPNCGYIHDDD